MTELNNLDFLSFTFSLSKDSKLRLNNFLKKANKLTIDGIHIKKCKSMTRYWNNYKLLFNNIHGGKSFVKISRTPIDKNDKHNTNRRKQCDFRIQFNPNNFGIKGTIEIISFLIAIIGIEDFKNIYYESRVTRIDICCGIDVNLESILPYSPKVKKYKKYKSGIELGSGKSCCKRIIYDRNANLLYRGGIKSIPQKYRYETRIRGLGCSIGELNMDSIYKDFMNIMIFNKSFRVDERFDDIFIRNSLRNGINLALNEIDDTTRKRYLRTLKQDYLKENLITGESINHKKIEEIFKLFKYENLIAHKYFKKNRFIIPQKFLVKK